MHQQGGTLAATDITIHRGADAILERVSLAVTPGSRIGVVGPNGRGKTTLLRGLAGLEPARWRLDHAQSAVAARRLSPAGARPLAGGDARSYLARRTGVGEVEAKLAALEPPGERPVRRRSPRRGARSLPRARRSRLRSARSKRPRRRRPRRDRSTGRRARSPAARKAARRSPRSCSRGSTSSCWTSRRTIWTSPGSISWSASYSLSRAVSCSCPTTGRCSTGR